MMTACVVLKAFGKPAGKNVSLPNEYLPAFQMGLSVTPTCHFCKHKSTKNNEVRYEEDQFAHFHPGDRLKQWMCRGCANTAPGDGIISG